jgi:hypothetical protein
MAQIGLLTDGRRLLGLTAQDLASLMDTKVQEVRELKLVLVFGESDAEIVRVLQAAGLHNQE